MMTYGIQFFKNAFMVIVVQNLDLLNLIAFYRQQRDYVLT
jgi:hypothetical protein